MGVDVITIYRRRVLDHIRHERTRFDSGQLKQTGPERAVEHGKAIGTLKLGGVGTDPEPFFKSHDDGGASMTNIELPRDAVGREIPLDTKVLYTADGIEVRVDDFVYGLIIHVNESTHTIVSNAWRVHSGCNVFDADHLYLIEPDSLKKLLQDLDRAADATGFGCCAYAGRSERDCSSCIASGDRACTQPIMRSIAFRIRELVGEDR